MKNRKINFIKLGILFLGISLILWNCQEQEIQLEFEQPNLNISTVSKSSAKKIFESYVKEQKKNTSLSYRKQNEVLEVIPNWSSFNQEELSFTDALLSNVNVSTNSPNNLSSRLIFINSDNKTLRIIESKEITDFDGDNIKSGNVYYHNLKGKFLFGLKVENGLISKKLVQQNNQNKASFFSMLSLFFPESDECDEDLVAGSEFCNDQLEEIVITGNSNYTPTELSVAWWIYGGSINNYDYYNWETGGSENTGGGSGSDDNSNSNNNDDTTNTCLGGKVYNATSKKCECPEGKVENFAGICIESPTPCETALLSRDVYNIENGQQELGTTPIPQELSGNWTLNTTLDLSGLKLTDSESGFNSAVYQKLVNGKYQYMYVTEGSTFEGLDDWINNANQLFGNSRQYEISANNATILSRVVGPTTQLFFTGHSLGGGLASVNALVTGRSAFTYNAAALSSSTKLLYDNGFSPQINAVIVKGEFLDKLQSRFGMKAEGNVIYIDKESSYWQDFFNERSPALNTYKSIRLHMINAVIDILECE